MYRLTSLSTYVYYDAKLYKLNNNFIIRKKINIKIKYLSPSKIKCIRYQPIRLKYTARLYYNDENFVLLLILRILFITFVFKINC